MLGFCDSFVEYLFYSVVFLAESSCEFRLLYEWMPHCQGYVSTTDSFGWWAVGCSDESNGWVVCFCMEFPPSLAMQCKWGEGRIFNVYVIPLVPKDLSIGMWLTSQPLILKRKRLGLQLCIFSKYDDVIANPKVECLCITIIDQCWEELNRSRRYVELDELKNYEGIGN